MNALETQLGNEQEYPNDKRKQRERDLDKEFDSMFKTRINEEHFL